MDACADRELVPGRDRLQSRGAAQGVLARTECGEVAVAGELHAITAPTVDLIAHLGVVADQLDVATVFVQEWRYLEGERLEEIVAERRRYEERIRALFREGRDLGDLRADLDVNAAALAFLSAANWAYTWLTPDRDTDALADDFHGVLVDGVRGYASRD